MTIQNIAYLCIGLFSGFMSGMFGIGGGSVRIPLLNLAGLPLLSAFGINLLVIPFSSMVGAIAHRKNIDKKIALYMIIGGASGS
ncbi:MAG: TSUP family transporter, partial [Chloroflexota bacterium]|nr:TSUP family transporter [Chloroflexota bacterium]